MANFSYLMSTAHSVFIPIEKPVLLTATVSLFNQLENLLQLQTEIKNSRIIIIMAKCLTNLYMMNLRPFCGCKDVFIYITHPIRILY